MQYLKLYTKLGFIALYTLSCIGQQRSYKSPFFKVASTSRIAPQAKLEPQLPSVPSFSTTQSTVTEQKAWIPWLGYMSTKRPLALAGIGVGLIGTGALLGWYSERNTREYRTIWAIMKQVSDLGKKISKEIAERKIITDDIFQEHYKDELHAYYNCVESLTSAKPEEKNILMTYGKEMNAENSKKIEDTIWNLFNSIESENIKSKERYFPYLTAASFASLGVGTLFVYGAFLFSVHDKPIFAS